MKHRLECMDAVQFLRTMSDESVDLIVTDPPYESLEKHRKRGTTTRLKKSKASSNDWFDIFPNARFQELFVEMKRVLKKNRHLYFMCDQETMFVAKPIGEDVGLKFWKGVVWHKGRLGMGYHYRAIHEMVLFFEKGKRRLNNLGIADVILDIPSIRGGYPCEKPAALYELLIRQSTQEGEIVCDPFMGAGSGLVAAQNTQRVFWGNDLSTSLCKAAHARLTPPQPDRPPNGEHVRCAAPGCKTEAHVKLPGTMPARWHYVWNIEHQESFRCCSDTCSQYLKKSLRTIKVK